MRDTFVRDDSTNDYRYDVADDYLLSSNEPIDLNLDQIWNEYIQNIPPVKRTALYRTYKFTSFYHPYVCAMIKQLNRYGIEGLLNPKPDTEAGIDLLRQQACQSTFDFLTHYEPEKGIVDSDYPTEGFDFDFDSPYGIYNWELFFHAPLLIATKLTQNQRFEEAQKWMHYIFNPTEEANRGTSNPPAPQRFWKLKPFFEHEGEDDVDAVLEKMASGNVAFNRQLDEWMKSPFQPHVIARLRIVAYMKSVVMKYIDNLIQWGDQLFRRDTIESINEATQLYILASQILGVKPVSIEKPATAPKKVKDILGDGEIEALSLNSALVDMESEIGDILTDFTADIGSGANNLNSILYFCTSPNDKLLGYWDTVADRLFKIRHCMNIEGVTRSLALFEPPIDPALLVKASAAGLSIGSVLNNLSGATLPNYRFRVLIQKANELVADVKGLGQSLLAALEKKDAEELALLRASQEINLLKAIRQIKKQAIEDSKENLASMEIASELTEMRRAFYSTREFMNDSEKEQLKRMDNALKLQLTEQNLNILGAALSKIGNLSTGVSGAFGSPNILLEFGGNQWGNAALLGGQALRTLAAIEQNKASKSGIKGGYTRRMDDWQLQTELATKELDQISRQIVGAEIRLAMAERELENHDMQIAQSQEVEAFMKDKYTNRDLYNWMITQVSAMYFQSYQLALDVARMAERSFRHELGKEDATFVQFGHWDSLKRGLLAGEKLQADLRRMEVAYLEQNKREYEMTRHIPLSILSPSQLVNLRESGACDFQIPEVLFDLDYPGQYMRRIKSVRITIPGVTGPFTNVNAKLTLLSNRIRKNTDITGGYAWTGIDPQDPRFQYNVAGMQSIAISSGQNDSGTFELNFQDERYLPFEGAGAISSWRLELPDDYRQFDYDTISDVIVHVSYTAREGGEVLKAAAKGNIEDGLNELANELVSTGKGLQRMFSLKTHFPNALYQLLQPTQTTDEQETSFEITKEHFPHFLRAKVLNLIDDTVVLLKLKDGSTVVATNLTFAITSPGSLTAEPTGGLDSDTSFPLPYKIFEGATGSPIDTWTIKVTGTDLSTLFNSTEVDDIYLIVNYTLS